MVPLEASSCTKTETGKHEREERKVERVAAYRADDDDGMTELLLQG